jgi:ketosteroid isomerase-like protein
MSQEHVELIRRGLEAWRRGDSKTLESLNREFVAPEFELHPLYLDKVYRGPDAATAMFADAAEFWTEYSFQIDDIIDADEHVITIGHVVGRGKGSGVPVDQRLATVWSFEGSKAVSAKTYPSKAQALESVGLSE